MATTIHEYKCPNCSGKLPYNALVGKMKCPYCDGEFDADALAEWEDSKQNIGQEKTDWEAYNSSSGSGDWQQEELDSLDFNQCPSCGSSVVGDKNTIATCCPYCGNTNIVKARASGMFRPDYVIPFKLDKKDAVKALESFQKFKPLLPSSFKDQNRIQMMQAVYVPFWLYDCDVHGRIVFRATKVSNFTRGGETYTKTDVYSCIRQGDLRFEKIPADGSVRMDDTLMDAIEPFDYSTLTDFNAAYLSGYLAEKYDVDAEQNKERITQRIHDTVEQFFRRDVKGYSSVQKEASNINIEHGKVHYALFPVWILNTEYMGQRYTFAMNGQTGKLTGMLPVSKKRSVAMIALVFAGLMAFFSALIHFLT